MSSRYYDKKSLDANDSASSSSSMSAWKIIIIVLFSAIVLLLFIWLIVSIYRRIQTKKKNEPLLVSIPTPIASVPVIDGKDAPLSLNGNQYTYAFWIYVQDWSTSFGVPKCILYRSNKDRSDFEVANPSVWFYPNENKLMVRVSTYSSENTVPYDKTIYPAYPTNSQNMTIMNPLKWTTEQLKYFNSDYTCDINNIPLQQWVHVSLCAFDRTLDVYINGKLSRSCILPGVPVFDPYYLKNIYVGRSPTFNGYISRFRYLNRAISPAEVYQLYRQGPLQPNWLWNSLKSRFGITVNFSSTTTPNSV